MGAGKIIDATHIVCIIGDLNMELDAETISTVSPVLFGISFYLFLRTLLEDLPLASSMSQRLAGAVTIVFMVFSMHWAINLKHSSEKQIEESLECRKLGGEFKSIQHDEIRACWKKYFSCGPDENKPGYTACAQNFKRIN